MVTKKNKALGLCPKICPFWALLFILASQGPFLCKNRRHVSVSGGDSGMSARAMLRCRSLSMQYSRFHGYTASTPMADDAITFMTEGNIDRPVSPFV